MTTDATPRPWQWWGAKKVGDDSRFIGGPHPFESEKEARDYFGNYADVYLAKVFDEGERDALCAQLAAAEARVKRLEEVVGRALASTRCRNKSCKHSWHAEGRAALAAKEGE